MLDINRVDLEHTERNMLDIAEFLWWARLEAGFMVLNHSAYVVDNRGLKMDDVIMQAYLDEELPGYGNRCVLDSDSALGQDVSKLRAVD